MKTKKFDKTILEVLYVIFWIIFIGQCIKAGTMMFNFILSAGFMPKAASHLYSNLNLKDLLEQDKIGYIRLVSLVVFIECSKAYMAYYVLKLFSKFKISQPFTNSSVKHIENISYTAFQTGIVALVAEGYSRHLMHEGTSISLKWGSGELLFFAAVIYLLAQVFKRGFELQTENELTV